MDKNKHILSLINDQQKTILNIFSNAVNRIMKLSAAILGLMVLPMLSSEASTFSLNKSMTISAAPIDQFVTSTEYTGHLNDYLSSQEKVNTLFEGLNAKAQSLINESSNAKEFYENITRFTKEVTQKLNQNSVNINLSKDTEQEVLLSLEGIKNMMSTFDNYVGCYKIFESEGTIVQKFSDILQKIDNQYLKDSFESSGLYKYISSHQKVMDLLNKLSFDSQGLLACSMQATLANKKIKDFYNNIGVFAGKIVRYLNQNNVNINTNILRDLNNICSHISEILQIGEKGIKYPALNSDDKSRIVDKIKTITQILFNFAQTTGYANLINDFENTGLDKYLSADLNNYFSIMDLSDYLSSEAE